MDILYVCSHVCVHTRVSVCTVYLCVHIMCVNVCIDVPMYVYAGHLIPYGNSRPGHPASPRPEQSARPGPPPRQRFRGLRQSPELGRTCQLLREEREGPQPKQGFPPAARCPALTQTRTDTGGSRAPPRTPARWERSLLGGQAKGKQALLSACLCLCLGKRQGLESPWLAGVPPAPGADGGGEQRTAPSPSRCRCGRRPAALPGQGTLNN